jgi:crossover junction endodeoxyribonuclease RuvC
VAGRRSAAAAASVKVIGIDPGLAATGIGIVTGWGTSVTSHAYGSIRTAAGEDTARRLEAIFDGVMRVLETERPELMIVEDVFTTDRFPPSGIVLGKVSGVILLAGQRWGLTVREVAVREAKRVLTGNGNASKAQLERSVRQALNAPAAIRPFHASDALGLALIGLYRYSRGAPAAIERRAARRR